MKDVNDLMQAILEMDAAQRKASEKARAERAARLAALDASKQAIAAECDAKAQADADAAAKAADAADDIGDGLRPEHAVYAKHGKLGQQYGQRHHNNDLPENREEHSLLALP